MMQHQKGFTLVELLIVITLVGILSAAIISGMNPGKSFRSGRDTHRKQIVNDISTGAEICSTENGGDYSSPKNCLDLAQLNTDGYVKVNYTTFTVPTTPSTFTENFKISGSTTAVCVSAKLEEPAGSFWKYQSVNGRAASDTTTC